MTQKSKWMDWQPTGQVLEKRVPTVPTKPTNPSSVSFVGTHAGRFSNTEPAEPPHDPAAWAEDVARWMSLRCRFRDNGWLSVHTLHNDFIRWAIENDSVPCQRGVFLALLAAEGCTIERDLVYGLYLIDDEETA